MRCLRTRRFTTADLTDGIDRFENDILITTGDEAAEIFHDLLILPNADFFVAFDVYGVPPSVCIGNFCFRPG